LVISALRIFLMTASVSSVPVSATTSPVVVDDVERQRAPHLALTALDGFLFVAQVDARVRREDADVLHALATEAVVHLFGELVAFVDEQFGLGALALRLGLLGLGLGRVLGRHLAFEADVFGDDGADDLTLVGAGFADLGEVELALGEEEPQDVAVLSPAEGAQERGGGELLLLVDVDVDDVVDVHRELDPRPAERNDARRDEALAVGVRRLLEDDAGGAVELADDDALGAIDDEGAELGEQRELAEIDFLLDDVAGALLAAGILEDDQLQRRLERRREGHVALDALLDGVLRLAEGVAHELEREVLVHVGDREQVLEDALQAHILALVRGGIQLQQRFEGARLDVQEIGHPHGVVELAERDLVHHGVKGSPTGVARGRAVAGRDGGHRDTKRSAPDAAGQDWPARRGGAELRGVLRWNEEKHVGSRVE